MRTFRQITRSVTLNVTKNVTNRMDFADNQSNWRAWFAHYGPRLLLFARQQTKNLYDAEDVLQEAMVRSWRNRNECGNPVIARVYQAIRYAAMDLGRKDKRRKIREQRVQEPEWNESNWFVCPMEEKERNRTLQEAMKSLLYHWNKGKLLS